MPVQRPLQGSSITLEEVSDELEQQIEELAEQYLSDLQAGRRPDRQSLLDEHPKFGSVLDRRLLLIDRVFRVAHTSVASDRETPERDAPTTSEIPRGVASAVRRGIEFRPPSQSKRSSGVVTVIKDPPVGGDAFVLDDAVHLKCPQCGSQVEVALPDADEITCRNCGSTFHVDSMPTRSYRPMRIPKRIGPFIIEELVGRGGFGFVYRAHDTRLDCKRALKVPRSGYFATAEEEDRFVREARSAARLCHPAIVQVHEIARDENLPYIVSDYIDGLTLSDLLTAGPIEFRQSAELMVAIADAIDFAHGEGVIHRDLKPSNILIDRLGKPHVTDFGLARRDDDEITVTIDGQIVGTPAYMSPEQASGHSHDVGPRSDVYSLGVILYRLFTGELPFRGNKKMVLHQVLHDEPRSPRHVNDKVPIDLETICLKAMTKEHVGRYESSGALAADLRRWLANEPILARPIGRIGRTVRWCRRKPLVASLIAAIVFLMLSLAAGGSGAATIMHGFWKDAETARSNEEEQRQLADQRDRESRVRLVRLNTARGIQLMEEGDLSGAAVWLAEAYAGAQQSGESDEMHRLRLAAVLRQSPRLTEIWFHAGPVVYAELSRDGSRVVTASEDRTARVWDAATGQPVTPSLRHADQVRFATFSPDGQFVVTASRDKTSQVWDASTGKPRTPPLAHDGWVRHASFSPDGQLVVTASDDNTARLWNATTGEPVGKPMKHESHVIRASFSPDGTRVLTASGLQLDAGEARQWDATTGEPIGQPLHRGNWVWRAVYSHDGSRIATASRDGTARVWNAETCEPITPPLNHNDGLLDIAFSPDGRLVATSSRDGTARLWDAESGRPVSTPLWHHASVESVRFSPDGCMIVTSSDDGFVRVWNAQSGTLATSPLRHGHFVRSASFAADGHRLITASHNGSARLWDLAAGSPRVPPLDHEGRVTTASFRSDGERVVTASADGTARVWNAATGEPVTPPIRHGSHVVAARFSPDGRFIATASSDHTARLWDGETGRPTGPPLKHNGEVGSIAFASDSRRVLTASTDNTAVVWDALDGRPLAKLDHRGPVRSVAFSPDGRLVATASDDFTARVWDAATGAPKWSTADHHKERVRQVAFSPNGQFVATASHDGTTAIWNTATGALIGAKLAHNSPVWRVAFSPDSRTLMTSTSALARAWLTESGMSAAPPIKLPNQNVLTVMFSPNGRVVLSASGPLSDESQGERIGQARLWDWTTGEPIAPASLHHDTVNNATFSPDGRRFVTASEDRTARVWDIADDPRVRDELVRIAGVLSGYQIDAVGGFVPMDPDALRSAWEELRARHAELRPAGPDDVLHWHREMARECLRQRNWPGAIQHLDALADANTARFRDFWNRGRAQAELGRWDAAVADLSTALGDGADEPTLWMHRALTRLASGDEAGYRDDCRQMLDRFGGLEHPGSLRATVRAAMLKPDAVPDAARLAAIAEAAVTMKSKVLALDTRDYFSLYGAAEYRASQLESAAKTLRRVTRTVADVEAARSAYFLAMTFARQEKLEEARAWFDKAVQWTAAAGEAKSATGSSLGARSRTAMSLAWETRFELDTLKHEAEALIGP